MKIQGFETFLANAGLRNYLFIRLRTDTGLTGVGEATLEWQEKTVQTLAHEWVEDRVLGRDPFDIEAVVGGMIRDQYQGGSTVMTAISGVEIALWDLIGKACGQPVYRLLGGRCHDRLPAYANGWYGGARTPAEYAERAREAVAPRLPRAEVRPVRHRLEGPDRAKRPRRPSTIVAAVREAVGPRVGLMIEFHGRLSAGCAIEMIRRLERFDPAWCEEPVAPESLDLLAEVKRRCALPIAAGERLYTLADFYRLTALRAADVVQMDLAHCGGMLGRQEDRRHGRRPGPARRPALLDRPGRPGRLPALRRQHAQLHDPGGLRRVRRALAQTTWSAAGTPSENGEFVVARRARPRPRAGRSGDRRASLCAERVPEPVGCRLADELHPAQAFRTIPVRPFRIALTGDFLDESGQRRLRRHRSALRSTASPMSAIAS